MDVVGCVEPSANVEDPLVIIGCISSTLDCARMAASYSALKAAMAVLTSAAVPVSQAGSRLSRAKSAIAPLPLNLPVLRRSISSSPRAAQTSTSTRRTTLRRSRLVVSPALGQLGV